MGAPDERNKLELQIRWHKNDLRRAVGRLSKGLPNAQAEVDAAKQQIRELESLLKEIP